MAYGGPGRVRREDPQTEKLNGGDPLFAYYRELTKTTTSYNEHNKGYAHECEGDLGGGAGCRGGGT